MTDDENNTALSEVLMADDIKDLILTIRGRQVLLDSDVARLYGYEVKRINEAASRNSKRFPERFRFQLTQNEISEVLRSQFATLNNSNAIPSPRHLEDVSSFGQGQHRKYRPFVYTEQGIGMLSGLLKNETAIQVSIGIIDAFVEMGRFINANHDVFAMIVSIDNKLLEHDHKFDEVFNLLQQPETVKQSIFYKGQFYDAFKLVIEIIEKAESSITIIDNYVDNSLFSMLSHKAELVKVAIITANPARLSKQHHEKFSAQHGTIELIASNDFHDRFIILDNKEVYAFGASFKDLGKKCFEVSRIEDSERFLSFIFALHGKREELRIV